MALSVASDGNTYISCQLLSLSAIAAAVADFEERHKEAAQVSVFPAVSVMTSVVVAAVMVDVAPAEKRTQK